MNSREREQEINNLIYSISTDLEVARREREEEAAAMRTAEIKRILAEKKESRILHARKQLMDLLSPPRIPYVLTDGTLVYARIDMTDGEALAANEGLQDANIVTLYWGPL
jgi:hypothetical protein